jgi:hypothetical protein
MYEQDFKHYMDIEVTKEDAKQMAIVKEVKIKEIRMHDIVEYIYERLDPRNNLKDSSVKLAFDAMPDETKRVLATSMLIYRYCIHRILTHFKVYRVGNWKYYLTDDYYSQDVHCIKLKPSLAEEIDKCLRRMITLRDSKKIEFILELEFKRVLPEARDREWGIRKVRPDQLKFTNESLLAKYRKEDLTYLKSYKLPRALCIEDQARPEQDETYRVIDGYHRLADIFERDEPGCLVIVALMDR